MNTNVHHAAGQTPITPGWLWFGLTAAAAAWALNLWGSYTISGLICVSQGGRIVAGPAMLSRTLLAVVALCLLAVSIAAGIASYRNFRETANNSHLLEAEGDERREFMALAGVLVSTALGVGIMWACIPLLLVNICLRGQ
jgi:hypothetical protein